MFDNDEKNPNIKAVAEIVERQFKGDIQEATERIKTRNRNENAEKYGCDCHLAKCYMSCPRYLTHSKEVDVLYWMAQTSPPDRKVTEYLLPMPAPPAKGGGNKSGRKRKKQPTFANMYLEC